MAQFTEYVKINCDDVVRRGLVRRQDFLSLYWQMQASFGDRQYGYRVCLHEAAHAVLMEQDGIQNVRFAGPDIIYNPAEDNFHGSSARAIGDDQPDAVVSDAYVFMITSHMVAGGVALRDLGLEDTGDEGDFKDFEKRYALFPPKCSKETAEQFWKRAQEAVAVRLEEPATKEKVKAKTDEYLRLLYPA